MEIITDLSKLENEAEAINIIDDADNCKAIIADLHKTLEEYPGIVALAAPQIGHNARIFCARVGDKIETYINPIITKKAGQTIFPETCASIPKKEYLIGRPEEVTVVYHNQDFKYTESKFASLAARVFDQMLQLLDGIFPNAYGLESDIEEDGCWSEATDEELAAAQYFYKTEYIPRLTKAYEAQLNSTEETTKSLRLYKLTEDVINGRTQIVDEGDTARVAAQNRAENQQNMAIKKAEFKQFAGKKCKK